MPNFSAKILNNAKSALSAQQALLAVTSTNIANVNTPGYTRRRAELETRITEGNSGGIRIGDGVQVTGVTRVTDPFLETLLNGANGTKGMADVEAEFMKRVGSLFNLTDNGLTIGNTLTGFFNSLKDLSTNPASTELRANVIDKAQALVDSLKNTYNSIAQLQQEADNRIGTEITEVNSLTSQIAEINTKISAVELGGGSAADERDLRATLLNRLGEKISFSTNETADGSVSVFLNNGFPLVNGGTSRPLSVTTTPSFATPPLPPSLNGSILSYVVYDFDTGAGVSHLDITPSLQAGEGSLSGLLKMRGYNDPTNTSAFQADGTLVEFASRIEAISRQLLTSVNTTYLGPDIDPAAGFQASAGDLNGNVAGVAGNPYALFDFSFGGTKDVGAPGNNLPDDIGSHPGVDNYTSLLQLAFTDPRRFAAARSTVTPNVFPQGDSQNVDALIAMETQNFTFAVGSVSFTGTPDDAYTELVTRVSGERQSAETRATVANDNLVTVSNRRDEVSGVSLDEEFSNLIVQQKAFQASARMIKIADDILTQIVQLI
jgi:flagellar hook-associated protein 1 FlgK